MLRLASPPPCLARILAVAALIAATCPHPALAYEWRVFIQTEQRQLRSMVLETDGVSTLPADSPREEQHRAALDDAVNNALDTARQELEREIARLNPDVRLSFLGEPEHPELAVFVLRQDELDAPEGQGLRVHIQAEVAYVLLLPGAPVDEPSPELPQDVEQLEMRQPDGAAPPEGVDRERMQQGYDALTQGLQERLRQLLEQ